MLRYLLFSIMITQLAFSVQVKDEVERDIDREDVPQVILDAIEPYLLKAKKIEYYQERDGKHKSFEIKFNYKGRKYSIEFHESGYLEDAEITIDFDDIPEDLGKKIKLYLKNEYDDYDVLKVQIQYENPGRFETQEQSLHNAMDFNDEGIIKFEIEIDAEKGKKYISYELLFDSNGNLIQKRQILNRHIDNILY